MIIVLLALILFALLFPGVLRFIILSTLALLGVLFVMEASKAAEPSSLPMIDVQRMCEARVERVMDPRSKSYGLNLCVDQEQYAYDNLKTEWDIITPNSKGECLRQSSTKPEFFNYQNIERCVRTMIQVEENNGARPHQFQP